MDLGIGGRRAILLASSRGLGRACAESVAREGVDVVVNGRTADHVTTAVSELRDRFAVEVVGVVGDSSTAEVHDGARRRPGSFDTVRAALGALREARGTRSTPQITPQRWHGQSRSGRECVSSG